MKKDEDEKRTIHIYTWIRKKENNNRRWMEWQVVRRWGIRWHCPLADRTWGWGRERGKGKTTHGLTCPRSCSRSRARPWVAARCRMAGHLDAPAPRSAAVRHPAMDGRWRTRRPAGWPHRDLKIRQHLHDTNSLSDRLTDRRTDKLYKIPSRRLLPDPSTYSR